MGGLRFLAPFPVEDWAGVLDTSTRSTVMCAQRDYFTGEGVQGEDQNSPDSMYNTTPGQEDCLYLNVYRPLLDAAPPTAPPLPVMVWIFGGGWTAGSGTWDEYGPQVVMMMMMMMI